MRLAKRVSELKPSATLAITSEAKRRKAEGEDIISFAAGEPDFETPEVIREEGKRAIDSGHTRYTPSSGRLELKEAVCEKLKRDNGLAYEPDEVIVSCGAKHSLYNIMQVLLDEGDEVVVPAPYWVTYPEQVRLAGGRPVFLKTRQEKGFLLDPEELDSLITPRTRLIILNSPANPTGAVYARERLAEIARVVCAHDILCVSDEIYEKLVYEVEHVSIASLSPEMRRRTMVVNGHSKAFAMTGWRIGYAAGSKEIVKAASNLQSQSTSNPCSISQDAALRALKDCAEEVEEMRTAFQKRRGLMLERLRHMPGVSCPAPDGAFYVFPNVSAHYGKTLGGIEVKDSLSFAKACLQSAKVAVVPGGAFGEDRCVRLSYACSDEDIRRGTERLAELLSG